MAHEINTPLGVSLMASSALKDQSRALSEHFAARTMTQSELTRYLDSAAAETVLIQQNLERIGSLVATFRQVAVEGKPLQFSVSIGVAQFDRRELSLTGWMARADAALYQAKAQGRNRVVLEMSEV